ncbi:MAG: glutamate--tRNA ligase [Flavobacteriaceae bacterium]|nr:glutamate--tRNA ligase [Flavobacteriaceae bacterium]
MSDIRVRFAPSPTGPLHIGGLRTALFNYLFAKSKGGTFVLRIEDTDQTRYVANAEQYITDSLEWSKIPFDEGPGKNEKYGPYRQSERKEIYAKYAKELIDNNKAYYCFDSAETLDKMRKESESNKTVFIYNHSTRTELDNSLNLSEEELSSKLENGDKYVIRFLTPKDRVLELKDEIRGDMKVDTNLLDDKILFKSDGMPTYHLANIVDDHLMKISHVIRGEEWLPSLSLHYLLYEAFGWEAPIFAHLPLILKPVGKGKLSKRDGDKHGFPVFPLEYTNNQTKDVSSGYKEEGYFEDAFINMLALLGWNPGTEQEIFSLEELVSAFSLDRVSKAGAKFNPEKAKWFNQQYLQSKDNKEIAEIFKLLLEQKNISLENDKITEIVSLVKERAVFVKDIWDLSEYLFVSPTQFDPKASKKAWKEGTSEIMSNIKTLINDIPDFEKTKIETTVKDWIKSQELGFGKVLQPLRVAIVGSMQGVDLFDIISFIGKQETVKRISFALESL